MGELLELEHAWAKALQAGERNVLDGLLAAEFRLSFVTGARAPGTVERAGWFANLERMSFGKFELSDPREERFGNVGVIHLEACFNDWLLDGQLLSPRYRITDVWIRRDGMWQVINRISEPLGEEPRF